jgi:hypothetical protein
VVGQPIPRFELSLHRRTHSVARADRRCKSSGAGTPPSSRIDRVAFRHKLSDHFPPVKMSGKCPLRAASDLECLLPGNQSGQSAGGLAEASLDLMRMSCVRVEQSNPRSADY